MLDVLLILLSVVWTLFTINNYASQYDSEKIAVYEEHCEDLETVKDYIIENYDVDEGFDLIMVESEQDATTLFYNDESIIVPDDVHDAFQNSGTLLYGDCIRVSQDRITFNYGALKLYVYSRDGKKPKYFYYEGDGMHPDIYKLGDGWYLMTVNFR